MFNDKNWSVKKEIIKRVNLESEKEHCKNYKQQPLPEYKRSEVTKKSVGWINFFLQLRP